MTLRTLLLGSAAALLTVGAAQAADLGAEPANYVKVCDAFGPGFYYAPGTDTCIKIGGYVLFDVNIQNNIDSQTYSGSTYYSNHQFGAWAVVNVTASSMTEYGPLVGFIEFFTTNNSIGVGPNPGVQGLGGTTVDEAYLSLGPLLAGYTWSIYNPAFDPSIAQLWTYNGNTRNLQARLSWAANGIGIAIAAEDYASRVTANVSNIPDITAAINATLGGASLHVGAGFGSRPAWATNTYGVSAYARFGLGGVANVLIGGTYSANGNDWSNSFFGAATPLAGDVYWTLFGALSANLGSQLTASVSAGYGVKNGANNQNAIIGNLTFRPVTNFSVAGEVVAANAGAATPWALSGKIRLRRDFP